MRPFFLIYSLLFFLYTPAITEIRKLFPNAATSETNAKEFALKLADVTESDDFLLAYKGASITVLAKYKKKISDRINTFKEGSKLIDKAISNDPNSIENRLVRLSVQENVPAIVKYKKNITEDKTFILKQFKEQSTVLKEYIKSFVLQSKSFSAEEQKSIK